MTTGTCASCATWPRGPGRARSTPRWIRTADVLGGAMYVPGPGNPHAEVEREGEAGIRMLAVAPEAQGKGVGRALLDALIARARADGRRGIALLTLDSMTKAHRLYETAGFRRDPERDWEIRARQSPALLRPGLRPTRRRLTGWAAAHRRSPANPRRPARRDGRPAAARSGRARGAPHPPAVDDGVRGRDDGLPGRSGRSGRRRPATRRPILARPRARPPQRLGGAIEPGPGRRAPRRRRPRDVRGSRRAPRRAAAARRDAPPPAPTRCGSSLLAGRITFADIADRLDLRLRPDRLVPIARWVTPAAYPRRFDASFFAAELPRRRGADVRGGRGRRPSLDDAAGGPRRHGRPRDRDVDPDELDAPAARGRGGVR